MGKKTAIPQQVILLDYECFSKHYRLITIGLSKQIKLEGLDAMQQTNFISRLDRGEAATMFFIIKKQKKRTFNLSKNHVIIV